MLNPENAVLKALITVAYQEAAGRDTRLPRDRIEQHIQKYRKTVQSRFGGVDDQLQALVAEVISDAASLRELAEHDSWDRAGALFCEGLEAAKPLSGDIPREEYLRQYHAAKTAMRSLLETWQN